MAIREGWVKSLARAPEERTEGFCEHSSNSSLFCEIELTVCPCFVQSARYALPGAMKRVHLHLREVHLHCDLTGFNFRSNQRIVRGVNDPEVTDRVLEAIEGKRLTYRRAHTAMHAKAKRPLRRFSNESQELPMGEFKAIQFCLLTGEVPGPVSLTLADAADPEKATKYLEIHLSIEKPKNLDALGLQLETLHAARDLIEAEIKRLLPLYEASRL